MDPTLLYEAIDAGQVDVIGAYTTDGRVAAYDLRVLEDDRDAIPPSDAVLNANGAFARAHPAILARLRTLEGRIDDDSMRAMNRAVDVDGETPARAAARHR